MKSFKLILNEKHYNINVIGPLDTYGENDKTHFSEIPLIEFREGNNKSKIYDIRTILNSENELPIYLDKTPLSSDDIKQIQNKLFETFPPSYLNKFASLPKPKLKHKF